MAANLGVDEEWITSRCGINTRSYTAENEYTPDIAYEASIEALEKSGISAEELDLIIVSTSTPERVFPSSACILQERLGNKKCPAFDLNATCSGFVYGLTVADKFIRDGSAKNVLVVGAEVPAKYARLDHPEVVILFGDGAGAAVLTASEEPGIIDCTLGADGSYGFVLETSRNLDAVKDSLGYHINMDGPQLFKQATKTMAKSITEILQRNNLTANDVDWIVPHQANERILLTTAKLARFPTEKVIITVDEHANTSSGTVPLALNTAIKDGRIKPGDLCLFVTFGAGFVWGSTLVRM